MSELPPKQYSLLPVDLTNRSEYRKAERDLYGWIRENVGSEAVEKASRAEQLVRVNTLKKIIAQGKMKAVFDWIGTFLETGEKLVVFADHRDVVEQIAMKYNAPQIYGGMTSQQRQDVVDRFQTDPSCNLIVLNIIAGGEGITLTESSNVLFCEFGWVSTEMDQAADRVHRIGQTAESINIYWMMAEQTIETDIIDLLESKRRTVEAVTDGTGEIEDVNIFDQLMTILTGRGED
jgi:SWI/SNF-related matrix-associated actin-dependent regulator 1 of chromatin subfamily A